MTAENADEKFTVEILVVRGTVPVTLITEGVSRQHAQGLINEWHMYCRGTMPNQTFTSHAQQTQVCALADIVMVQVRPALRSAE